MNEPEISILNGSVAIGMNLNLILGRLVTTTTDNYSSAVATVSLLVGHNNIITHFTSINFVPISTNHTIGIFSKMRSYWGLDAGGVRQDVNSGLLEII